MTTQIVGADPGKTVVNPFTATGAEVSTPTANNPFAAARSSTSDCRGASGACGGTHEPTQPHRCYGSHSQYMQSSFVSQFSNLRL